MKQYTVYIPFIYTSKVEFLRRFIHRFLNYILTLITIYLTGLVY